MLLARLLQTFSYMRSPDPRRVWSGIGVKIKVSFYYAVLLFYVVVYAFTHAAFALLVAHFSFKVVNISFYSACIPAFKRIRSSH